MRKTYFFILIFALVLLVFFSYAQEDNKWNSENLKDLTADDIINNPGKARQHWSGLSEEQKNSVYGSSDGLKEFSDKFASEKGIKSADFSAGSPYHDGTYLVNGNTRIPVSAVKNAEVTSLKDYGFRIKFPSGSDVRVSDFSGAGDGLAKIEGDDLNFGEFSYDGVLDVYNPTHFRMEPNSNYLDVEVGVITSEYPVDLFYGPQPIPEQGNIQFDNKKISVKGDGIRVRFTDGNRFEELVVDGEITIENGGVTIEFDGEGNAYEEIPLGEPKTPLTIEDENAPDKEYVLNPGDDSIEQVGFLEGFGGCGISGITGTAILGVTGRAVQDICKGPVVEVGQYKLPGKLYGYYYDGKFWVNQKQLDQVMDQFIKDSGSVPNFDSQVDSNKFSNLMNEKVTDMKFEQEWRTSLHVTEYAIRNKFEQYLKNAKLNPNSLTPEENNQLNTVSSSLPSWINNGDKLEYQLSGDKGLIVYKAKNGQSMEFDISGRVARAIMRNFYDSNVNKDKVEARNLVKNSATKAAKK